MRRGWPKKPSAVVVDATTAVLVFVVTLGSMLLARGAAAADFRWWWIPAVAVTAVPIIWYRKAPLLVFLITFAVSVAVDLVVLQLNLSLGILVATFGCAAFGSGAARLLVPIVSLAVLGALATKSDLVDGLFRTGVFVAGAYALGAVARSHQDRVRLLEERSRRLAQEREAAASAERARIARDTHDVLAHSVGLMVVQAEGGAAVAPADPARAVRAFDAIADTGREALVQLRHVLGVLRQAEADPGLDVIAAVVDRSRHPGLDVSLTQTGVPAPLSQDAEHAVHRMVQEALTNVVRHSRARQATVSLEWTVGELRVAISDDGIGSASSGCGHGLTGMRERIAACGGRVEIGPGPDGAGFVVLATLPTGADSAIKSR